MLDADRGLPVCGTYRGPSALRPALGKLVRGREEIAVVNTHADWDHVWGTCLFADNRIIGHRLCRDRLMAIGPMDLAEYAGRQRGEVRGLQPTRRRFSRYITSYQCPRGCTHEGATSAEAEA